MLKAVIADDERKIRNVILGKGEWKELGIIVAGEASDGDALCEMAELLKPDIILTDMRMPGTSGADLIKKLADNQKNAKIIVISGYDDFEYLKQAIQSKALDYILKPVDSQSLNNALRKAVTEIEGERIKKVKMNEVQQLLNENLMDKLTNGIEITKKEFLKCLDLPQEPECCNYRFALVKIENFKDICSQRYGGDYPLLYFTAVNIINELTCGQGKAFKGTHNYEIVILFYRHNFKEKLILLMEDILEKLESYLQIRIFAGIGRAYLDYREARSSYNEARAVIMQINIIGGKRIAFFDEIASFYGENKKNLFRNEDVLTAAIENRNTVLIYNLIEELYNDVENRGYTNINEIRKLNNDVIFLLESLIEKADGKVEFVNEILRLRSNIENEISITIIKKAMKEFTENVSSYISSKKSNKEKSIIYEIRDYIEANYKGRLSLNELAQRYYWSKQYISTVFKEEFGINLFDYINNLKIEKAKAMLAIGEVKAAEIAEQLGFTDESHFSKVFKKITGMSPKTYKDKIIG